MRLETGTANSDSEELKAFSKWILSIGDGMVGEANDGEATFDMPDELLIQDCGNPITAIVDITYPNLFGKGKDQLYLQERAILAPTLDIINKVNEYTLSTWPGEEMSYLSSDSVCRTESDFSNEDVYTPEILNDVNSSRLPYHKLTLNIGLPVMLFRNIDQTNGFCNDIQLVVTQLGKHVIEAEMITGYNIGQKVFIPRMALTPSNIKLSFKFQRRQYPLVVCFVMTIHKSQGQSLSHVGLYLSRPVFSHSLSRITSKKGLKILICDKESKT